MTKHSLILVTALSVSMPLFAGDGPQTKWKPVVCKEEKNAPAPERRNLTSQEKLDARQAIMRIGKAQDNIAADVEEYGTVSMSSPLLTLPTRKLNFGLENTAATYYDQAKTQVAGRAFSAVAIAHALGVDLQGSADLDQIAAARALAKAMAPDRERYQKLVDGRNQRADIAYRLKMQKAKEAKTPEKKATLEAEAISDRDTILKEDIINPAM